MVEIICEARKSGYFGVEKSTADLTFSDALPYTILVDLSQPSYSLGISPSDEVCFLELTHESLFARFGTGRLEKFLCWRRREMKDKAHRDCRELRLGGRWPH